MTDQEKIEMIIRGHTEAVLVEEAARAILAALPALGWVRVDAAKEARA